MQIWIFSDLHLTDTDSPLYSSFLQTLAVPSSPNDVVVFSGDIFDLVVGDSVYYKNKFERFFTAVEALHRRGVKVHYIEGNHDFHLRGLFSANVEFHEESVVLTDQRLGFAPKKIYIAHGDLVDEADRGYLFLRKVLRSRPIASLSQVLPGTVVQGFGNLFSRSLDQKARDLPETWSANAQERLRFVFRQFAKIKHESGYDFIVLGHCHDLDQVEPYYFNMGYPPIHNKYLFYGVFEEALAPRLGRKSFA